MEQGSGENVIYVQVDEDGRVVNYTSNMPGLPVGEQVILLQEGGDGQQMIVNQPSDTATKPPAPQQPTVMSTSTVLSQQTTLVDQSGVPVMVVGQPQVTSTITQPVAPASSGGSSSVLISSPVSSGVVDQSGVPVMVLGEARPSPSVSQSTSHLALSSSIIQTQKPTSILPSKPLMTKPIAQGRSLLISKQMSSGSSIVSPPKNVITASGFQTSRQLGSGSSILAHQKISQGSSLLISKGPGGSIVIPKPGNKPGIIVSRPMTQATEGTIVSRAKTQATPGISGIVKLSKPIQKPTHSISHVTVTQPVLRFINEEPKQSTVDITRNQAAEVSSTVNGTDDSIENTSNDPIEIPDEGNNEADNPMKVDNIHNNDSPSIHGQEVLKDVQMSNLKEFESKSEDEMNEAEVQKDLGENKDNKTEKDLDNDLMMYLGGANVPDNQEGKHEEEIEKTEEAIEKIENKELIEDKELTDVEEIQKEIEEEDNVDQKTSEVSECLVDQEDSIIEKSSDKDKNLITNKISDENYEDDEDEDEDFPAGLIRGEPIPGSTNKKVEVKDKREDGVEVVEVQSEKDVFKVQDNSQDNNIETHESIANKMEFEEPESEQTMEDNENEESVIKGKVGRPRKSLPGDSDKKGRGRPPKNVDKSKLLKPASETVSNQTQSSNGADQYMFGFEELSVEGEKPQKKKSRPNKTTGNISKEDIHKETFMAKFNLVSPKEMQKLNRRSSKRVLHAEAEKHRTDFENEDNPAKPTTMQKVKKIKGTDEDSNRQNIFELFDSSDTDVDSLQAKVKKLQTLNTELKNKLRETEHKLITNQANSSRYHEVKSMQHKIEKLEKLNGELTMRIEEYEGKPTQERTVDVSFKMGNLSFKTPGTLGSPPGKKSRKEDELIEKVTDLKAREETLDKKERKLRALDQELDLRASMLKSKESKLQRLITDIKTREQKLEYQDSAIERRVKDIEYRERMLEGKTKAALEKMHKSGGRGSRHTNTEEDALRSAEMKRFEQEQKDRELKEKEAALKERELAMIEREKATEEKESELQGSSTERKYTPGRKLKQHMPRTKKVEESSTATIQRPSSHRRGRTKTETPKAVPDVKSKRSENGQTSGTSSRESTPVTHKGRGRPPKTLKDRPSPRTPKTTTITPKSQTKRGGSRTPQVSNSSRDVTPLSDTSRDSSVKNIGRRRPAKVQKLGYAGRRSTGTNIKTPKSESKIGAKSVTRKRSRTVSPAILGGRGMRNKKPKLKY